MAGFSKFTVIVPLLQKPAPDVKVSPSSESQLSVPAIPSSASLKSLASNPSTTNQTDDATQPLLQAPVDNNDVDQNKSKDVNELQTEDSNKDAESNPFTFKAEPKTKDEGVKDEEKTKETSAEQKEEEDEMQDYLHEIIMEEELVKVLSKFKITNASWMVSRDGNTTMVTFVVESGRKEEDVLDRLLTKGIGKSVNTSVCISPLSVCIGPEYEKMKKTTQKLPAVDSQKSLLSTARLTSQASDLHNVDPSPANSVTGTTTNSSVTGDVTAETIKCNTGDTDEATGLLADVKEVELNDTAEQTRDAEAEEESEFRKSIKSRIIIQPVVASLKRNAEFTFDYLMFVILASVISGVGLIENNSVILVASMLISPLMGPILAGTFGAAIGDHQLRKIGMKSELLGLGICILCGFILGLPVVFIMASGTWNLSSSSWPAPEMFGRGLPRNLLAGAVIAIVSGAAVALSVLGDNQGSLVGVAISASLLPPAVNTGLLWALSFQSAVYPFKYETAITTQYSVYNGTANTTILTEVPVLDESSTLGCSKLLDNDFTPYFTCNLAREAFILGLISLCLTLINILFIIFSAMLFLKIKQVSPRASVVTEKSFWTEHMKVARDYNTTVKTGATDLGKTLLDQIAKRNISLSHDQVRRIRQPGTPFDLTVPDLDTRIDPHSAPSQYHTTRQRPKTEYIELDSYNENGDLDDTSPDGKKKRPQKSLMFRRQPSADAKLESAKFGQQQKTGRFTVATKEDDKTKSKSSAGVVS